ncbi:MAG: M48 family metalloprotease [Pirellulaceae bacterium]|nr:M48 family metalloprotease [Pirellulaceae bacterium]
MAAETPGRTLQPPPYLEQLVEWLQREEPELWEWFFVRQDFPEQLDAVRLDLLKTTYRLEQAAHPAVHELARRVSGQLAIDAPLHLYQLQAPAAANAGLAYLPGEIHLVFSGPVLDRLEEAELTALLGHELTHYLLWQVRDGEFFVADQLLAALSLDPTAGAAYAHSWRLFQLYSEICCDRGSLAVVDDPAVTIRMLVRLATGLDRVDAASYLRQADEVVASGALGTEEVTHPETFIRARALRLWVERVEDVERQVAAMIEGPPALDRLDLLQQRQVRRLTRRLLDELLRERWLRTEAVQAQARLYFDDYEWPRAEPGDELPAADYQRCDERLRDYFCFVLLDFVTADRELESYPLAAALRLADQLGLHQQFCQLALKELRLRKNQLAAVNAQRDQLLADARQSPSLDSQTPELT